MFQILAGALAFFYGIVDDYAVAIALLTLAVMLALSPLTWKSTRSMLAMQRLQPEVKKLQQKYKGGDRQQMNQEVMALYKEHQVNPLSGCLPMLVQLPVLFVMYHVIRGLTHIEAGKCEGFDPKYLDRGTELFQDLCSPPAKMMSFGIDLSQSASQALQRSVGFAVPFALLTGLVAFVQYYQTRQMTRRNPQASQSPQMQMMTRVMPVMFGVFSFAFPAGLNVYWLISGLFRVGQQGAMYRWDPTLAAHVREKTKEVEAKSKTIEGKAKAKPAGQAKGQSKAQGQSKARAKANPSRPSAKGPAKSPAKSSQSKGKANGAKDASQARTNTKTSAHQPRSTKKAKGGNGGRSRKRRAKKGR